MSAQRDWADELAETIISDARTHKRHGAAELIAARLRVVQQEGVGIGLAQARAAVSETKVPGYVFGADNA